MRARPRVILLLAVLAVAAPAFADGLEPGKAGAGFSLPGPDGEVVTLKAILGSEGTRAVVVYVTSYECPFARKADEKLPEAVRAYAEKGVRFVGIYPNRAESAEGMAAHARKAGLSHLLLTDAGGKVSKALGAEVTPTFFLFDTSGVLRHRGNLEKLRISLDAVLAGDQVASGRSSATGCTIKWPATDLPERPVLPERPDAPETAPGADGERPVPPPRRRPALSEDAKGWLDRLVVSLGSEDEMVRRSAQAGIGAFGPAALPHLEELGKTATGRVARELSGAIARLKSGPRGPPPAGRPGADRRGRRGSMVDRVQESVLREIDLDEERKKELKQGLREFRKREKALLKRREAGEVEGLREDYRRLMTDLQAKLAEVLTPEEMQRVQAARRGRGGGGRGRPR